MLNSLAEFFVTYICVLFSHCIILSIPASDKNVDMGKAGLGVLFAAFILTLAITIYKK